MAGLAAARMSGGSEFHAAGPACEKEHSPNLVRSRGVTYLLLEADRMPVGYVRGHYKLCLHLQRTKLQ